MSIDHYHEAKINPEPYAGSVKTPRTALTSIEACPVAEAAKYFGDIPPLTFRKGFWAICKDGLYDGIYCLCTCYHIEKSKILDQNGGYNWEEFMPKKTWASDTIQDFLDVLGEARRQLNSGTW